MRANLLALACLTTPALAGPVQMSADEVAALLTGRTAVGVWAGARYRQWFAEDGLTIYAQEGARSSRGKWRVNNKTDAYESWWGGDPSAWDVFVVLKDGETLFWSGPGAEPPVPFTMEDGQQLVFSD